MEEIKATEKFNSHLQKLILEINEHLDIWLPKIDEDKCSTLHKSCRYSVLAGGKRIRAALAVLTGRMYRADDDALMRLGCAIELIHTFSLIHDDLPAMDDDDFRRGKPANHKVFGEGMAILAGDSLLTLAFSWLSSLCNYNVSCEKTLAIVREVTEASGHKGMIGGQVLDLEAEKTKPEPEMLERIHLMKTGALLKAPIRCAAILAGAPAEELETLSSFANKIGLLFQVKDDILDVEGNTEVLGKTTGADARMQKSTYPVLLGLDGAKSLAGRLSNEAKELLRHLQADSTELAQMVDLIYARNN
jgi:geranylgeranyl diphosphate synthase type II